MSGSREAAKTASISRGDSSPVPSSPAGSAKETALEANTANDIRAYLQIMRHSADNAMETGIEVKIWQSDSGGVPVVLFAVFAARLCGICGNVYPDGEICGICAERNIPQKTEEVK